MPFSSFAQKIEIMHHYNSNLQQEMNKDDDIKSLKLEQHIDKMRKDIFAENNTTTTKTPK